MNKKAIVLGCGRVGAAMVRDLAGDGEFQVTAVDVTEENLRALAPLPGVAIREADLSDSTAVSEVIADQDVVLGALPSKVGFQTLRAVIEAGRPYCDISFMSEDPLGLDGIARQGGVTAVVDCGVSPGLSNLCVGHAYADLDQTERAVIYVGGLPKVRHWPYEYKAPFAPSDVIEEYTRPARLIENGEPVEKPALSDPELIDFSRAGTLEGFNTDGLRTLLHTLDIPFMKEKTLRYPGHAELMRVFRETGFFGKDPVAVGDIEVRPLDVASRLLFAKWKFAEGEEDFTIMRVVVDGWKSDEPMRYTYDLFDEYDRSSNTSSMARTTAFPCTILARMLARGELGEAGVYPLELLASREGLYDMVTRELAVRGVHLTMRVETL